MSNWNNRNVTGWANRTLTAVNDDFEAKRLKAMRNSRISEAANKAADIKDGAVDFAYDAKDYASAKFSDAAAAAVPYVDQLKKTAKPYVKKAKRS